MLLGVLTIITCYLLVRFYNVYYQVSVLRFLVMKHSLESDLAGSQCGSYSNPGGTRWQAENNFIQESVEDVIITSAFV